ncbi:hypothetical protein C8R43DRAFT_1038456 [Mycena crocata]|nr:hypothetical protein C8R43DRAFT_1038456 [Mycena crocata]
MSERFDETQRFASTSHHQPPPYRPVTPPHRRVSPSRPVRHTPPHLRGSNGSRRASYVLTCGSGISPAGEVSIPSPYGSTEKYVVPFLPFPLENPMSQAPREKPSTGCGTRIHISAHPGRIGWVGSGEDGGNTIVPLPAEYFTAEQKEELDGIPRKENCGCITTGIGCCVCGNILGAQKTRCAAHRGTESHATRYNFLASAVSPPIPLARKRRVPLNQPHPQPTPRTPPRTPANATPHQNFERRSRAESEPLTQSEMDSLAAQMDAEAEEEEAERVAAEARFHADVGEGVPSHPQPFLIPTQLRYDGITLPLPIYNTASRSPTAQGS